MNGRHFLTLLLLLLGTSAGADIRQIALPASDLVYDRFRHVIYASVPSSGGALGNSVVAIDPLTGEIAPPIFVGSEPGKLAISAEGRYLYVALDGTAAVRRVDLARQQAELQFSLGGDDYGLYYVGDMEVSPDDPQVLAISRLNRGQSPGHAGVAVYDNGSLRPKVTSRFDISNVIEFSATGSRLYGYNRETSEYGFRRMAIDPSGVTILDVTPNLFVGPDVDMKWNAGLIYTTGGRVVDPERLRLVGTFTGLGYPTLVAPDTADAQVYFLTGTGSYGMTPRLLSFDRQTFLPTGSLVIPGLSGQPGSLIRWGEEREGGGGLAFRTDQGQLFLIRLTEPSGPARSADLSVYQFIEPFSPQAGKSLTYTLMVANSGPDPATGVTLVDLPPAGASFVSVTASQGSCVRTGDTITCRLGSIGINDRAEVKLVVTPAQPGEITHAAGVVADQPDPMMANNAATVTSVISPAGGCPPGTSGCMAPFPGELRQIALPTRDLVYSRRTGKLYASVPSQAAGAPPRSGGPGNSVTAIDPLTGAVGPSIFVGSEPGKLALADDYHSLYVALDGAAAVRRVDLDTLTAGPPFVLGSDPEDGPLFVEDMAVLPGDPDAVAVARQNMRQVYPRNEGVAIYDNGVPRPTTPPRFPSSDVLQFSDLASRLYGFDTQPSGNGVFRRMTVDASGVSVIDETRLPLGPGIRFADGRLYGASGAVIDPEARRLLGSFTGTGMGSFSSLVLPDPQLPRVFFLTDAHGPVSRIPHLLAFDPSSFLPVGAVEIPQMMDPASSLIRWGGERSDGGGLAFRTDGGQLFILRSPLITAPALSLTAQPTVITAGRTATITASLASPAPAEGTVIRLTSSNPALAAVPPSITIPGGAQSASFPVATYPLSSSAPLVLTASNGGLSSSATVSLWPAPLAAVDLQSESVFGGLPVSGSVTLLQPAPAGGAVVTLNSSSPEIAGVPASVVVPAGATTVSFSVATRPVSTTSSVEISASFGGVTRARTLQVLTLTVASVTLRPAPARGGTPVMGTVTLTGPAPDGGAEVTLSSTRPDLASVPPSVTVPAGASSVTFPVTTYFAVQNDSVTISASLRGGTQTATLPVLATRLVLLAVNPTTVTGGQPATGTVVLGAPAPNGGIVVRLGTGNQNVATVPMTVTIPAGAASASFPVTTYPVMAPTTTYISVAYQGLIGTTPLTVTP